MQRPLELSWILLAALYPPSLSLSSCDHSPNCELEAEDLPSAHGLTGHSPLQGDQLSPRLTAKERKTPTLVMIKGWLKSMPPESLNPQGAGPGRTTFWGMVSPGAAFLGWRHLDSQGLGRSEGRPCPRWVSRSRTVHYAPRAVSSLLSWTAAGELYPRSRVTSPIYPPPDLLPPRRAPTLEERDAPDPREFTDSRRLGAASRPLQPALEKASGYDFHHSIKVTPVLFFFYWELSSALHLKLKAVKQQSLSFQLK